LHTTWPSLGLSTLLVASSMASATTPLVSVICVQCVQCVRHVVYWMHGRWQVHGAALVVC
jgi:heme/copper-type cytochrome/quinol oxidase subunit 4